MPQTGTAWVPVLPDTRKVTPETRRAFAGLGPFAVPVEAQLRGMEQLRAALAAIPHIVVPVDVDDRELMALRAQLQALSGKTVGLNISAGQARAELADITQRLDALSGRSTRLDVRVDAGAASAALRGVDRDVSRIDGRTASTRVIADTASAVAGLAAVLVAANAINGNVSTLSVAVDSGAAIAGLAMAAARAEMLGGAAGAVSSLVAVVLALGPAGAVAAGGLAAAVLGFGGVGKALTALGAQQESAGADAAASAQKQAASAQQVEAAQRRVTQTSQAASQARSDAARNVARAESEAAKQVENAQKQASRSITQAEKQAEAAHRSLRAATADLAREQRNLTAAWEAGRRSLEDLQDQLDSGRLDQEQAALDLKQAEQDLAEARASGNVDEIARADLAYRRQLETIDQLNKRVNRLGTDNATAQRAGVAGSAEVVAANDRVTAARDRQTEAARAAREADAAVDQARRDGADAVAAAREAGEQRIADAREQGQRQIAAADAAALEAQRALTQALAQTGDTGSSAAGKVASAFADLSPAAATFVRYLWSLRDEFDQLKASAASGLFPPIQAGIAALVTQLPALIGIVGRFGAAMGGALGYVLTQLASPFWIGFFDILSRAAGPILMQLAQAFMAVAGVVAQLIVALLPFTPMAIDMLTMVAMLVDAWTPFIALFVGQLLPVAGLVLQALMPLGPVLGTLAPILAVLATAFAMVLEAGLRALAPILVALTPLIAQLALAFASQLVAALQAATPFLVGLATWMSQNPQLVIGVVTALVGLIGGFGALKAALGGMLGPLFFLKLGLNLLGPAAAALLAPFGAVGAVVAGFFAKLLAGTGVFGLIRTGLSLLGQAVLFLVRMFLVSLGPIGAVIGILGFLFVTNEQFRGAVMQLVGALLGLVGQIIAALMPALAALLPVFTIVGQVAGALAGGLATALVPVVTALARVIEWLSPILAPLAALFLGIRVALLAWAAAQWLLNTAMAMNPVTLLVIGIAALIGAVVWAYQNLSWFRTAVDAVGAAFVWVWRSVLQPVVDFFVNVFGAAVKWVGENWSWLSVVLGVMIGPIGWLILAFTTFRDTTMAVVYAVGGFFSWLWTTVLQPIFSAIWTGLQYLGAIILTVLVAPFVIAWNIISAIVMAVWSGVLQPIWYGAIVPALQFLGSVFTWLWVNIIVPAWNGIVAAVRFAWGILSAIWNGLIVPALRFLASVITWLWVNVAMPAWNGIVLAVQFAWGILSAIWNGAIVPALRFLGSVFMWLWQNIIVPAWNGISSAASAAWGFIDRFVFAPLRAGIDGVGRVFEFVAGWIARAWDTIREAARAPVKWVVDLVYNRGVLPVWNGIAGLFGLGKLGPVMFASGGVVPAEPFITNGPQAIVGEGNPRYPEYVIPTDPKYRGRASNLWAAAGGDLHMYARGGTLGTPPSAPAAPVQMLAEGGILGWLGGVWKDITAFTDAAFGDPVGAVKGLFKSVVGDSNANPGGPRFGPGDGKGSFVPALQAIPGKVIDGVIKKVKEWIAAQSAGGANMGPPTRNQMGHTREIAAAARERGIPHAGAVIAVMTGLQESGVRILANPKVPASLGFWHEGLGYDHDSTGIFQQRTSGWGTQAMRMNARASAGMFLNKLGRGPYGEYGREAQRVQVSAFPGAYSKWRGKAEGMVSGVGYDRGGLALGRGVMLKDVIQPERVLSPSQTQSYDVLDAAVRHLDAGRVGIDRATTASSSLAAAAGAGNVDRSVNVQIDVRAREHQDLEGIAHEVSRRLAFELAALS